MKPAYLVILREAVMARMWECLYLGILRILIQPLSRDRFVFWGATYLMLFGWHFESSLPTYVNLHLPTYPLVDGLVIYALSLFLSHSVLLHSLVSRLVRLLRSPITLVIPYKPCFDETLTQVRILVGLAALLTRSHLLLCLNLLVFDHMYFSKEGTDRVIFRVKVAWLIGLNADKVVVDLWRYTDFLLNF